MGEFGINRTSNNFTILSSEFCSFVVEGNNFGWADKSKIKRVEEKKNIFPSIILIADNCEVSVVPGLGIEERGRFSDE